MKFPIVGSGITRFHRKQFLCQLPIARQLTSLTFELLCACDAVERPYSPRHRLTPEVRRRQRRAAAKTPAATRPPHPTERRFFATLTQDLDDSFRSVLLNSLVVVVFACDKVTVILFLRAMKSINLLSRPRPRERTAAVRSAFFKSSRQVYAPGRHL